MNEMMAALAGFAALYIFFRAVESNWPSAYFKLDSALEYAIARTPARYVIFRLGPVFLVSLFVASTLERYGDDPHLSVVGLVVLHVTATSGRVVIGQMRALLAHRVVKWPLVILAALVTLGSAGAGMLATILRSELDGLIPAPSDLASEIWGGTIAAVGAVYLLRVVQDRSSGAQQALVHARKEIPPKLWLAAEQAGLSTRCDPVLLEAVMVLENAQRPRWFRRLERIKGHIVKPGTYGIMQTYSPSPISDQESISLMSKRLATLTVPGYDHPEDRNLFFRSLAIALNGDPRYGEDLESLYNEFADTSLEEL